MMLPYAFIVRGARHTPRRLVDAAGAYGAFADCDDAAGVERESYLSAFCYGDALKQRQRADGTLATAAYDGVLWAPLVWWDIDCPGNLQAAVIAARRLAASLVDRYAIDGDELAIFFSGSKGFHIGLPVSLWNPQPSQQFHHHCRAFALAAAERCGVMVDKGVYAASQLFRSPNSRHPKTGWHKRWLTFDELLHLPADGIVALAAEPEPFEWPLATGLREQAAADWQQVLTSTHHTEAAGDTSHAASVNRITRELLAGETLVGDRHRHLFSAAANLAEYPDIRSLIHGVLTEPGRDIGLSPSDVFRQIELGIQHARKRQSPLADGGKSNR